MNLNLIFISTIFLIIVVLLGCIIKTILDTKHLNIEANRNYLNLLKALQVSKKENKIINNKMVLIEGLYKTLFNRLFKINTELILAQKLVFDKRT